MDRQTITVDIAPEGYADRRLKVSQYDVGRPLGVYIKQDGADLDCSAYTAQLYLYKPDRTNIEKSCTIAGNLITWDTAEQETIAAGICVAEIRIQEGSRNVGTANFTIWVEESPADTSGSSHSESQSLIDMVDRAEDAAETAESSAAIAVHAKDETVAAAEAVERFDQMTAEAETLAPGSEATVEMDYTGEHPVMKFGIPAGATGPEGRQGQQGQQGEPGVSPVVSVSDITGGHRVTITDAEGTHTFDVLDGGKGDPGQTGPTGPAGYSPTVAVTDITGGHRVTITDQQGQHPFDVMDGEDSAVLSVNGKTGQVVLDGGDINVNNSAQTPVTVADELGNLNRALNDVEEKKADVIIASASGSIASFSDGADDMPLKDCVVQIEPVQDLHGYDNPWPAGGGKNKLNIEESVMESAGYNRYFPISLEAGTYTITVFSTFGNGFGAAIDLVDDNKANNITIAGSYAFGKTAGAYYTFTLTEEEANAVAYLIIRANGSGITFADIESGKLQIEPGSTATSWTPYSNICPITGWTGANVNRTGINIWDEQWENGDYNSQTGAKTNKPTKIRSKNAIHVVSGETYYMKPPSTEIGLNAYLYDGNNNYITYREVGNGSQYGNNLLTIPDNVAYLRFSTFGTNTATYNNDISINYPATDTDYHPYQGQTYPISWQSDAGTIYGGTLDVTTGTLVVDRANIASYNGETLPGEWISDRDVYEEGTTPTTGAQVVYELATPITYQLTPVEIRTILGGGINNIWADCGDTAVQYPADTKAYVDGAVPVTDVQIAGTSILQDGVANIPLAGVSTRGVVKLSRSYGIDTYGSGANESLGVIPANTNEVKGGYENYDPIVPSKQHESAFYGLAKAAGDSTQSASSNAVGTYTESAKSAIKKMLGFGYHNYELIRMVTTTEDTQQIIIDADEASNSFALKGFLLLIQSVGASGNTREHYLKVSANTDTVSGRMLMNSSSGIRRAGSTRSYALYGICFEGIGHFVTSVYSDVVLFDSQGNINNTFAQQTTIPAAFTNQAEIYKLIIGSDTSTDLLGDGSIVALYGIKA